MLGFKFKESTISSNELLFIENAMCEYVYEHFNRCLTTSPQKKNCTKTFRKRHYHLSGVQIHTCENYMEDIEAYIAMFPAGIFPSLPEQEEVLHISGKKAEATAYISGNQIVVCKGSEFSITETSSCPVRAGCSEDVLKAAAGMEPERIVYVSCNPATFARDAKILESLGYKVKEVQPVDMFPQTMHVETVSLLEKE